MSAFLESNNHPPPPNDRAWHAMVILVIIHIFTSKCETGKMSFHGDNIEICWYIMCALLYDNLRVNV